MTQSPRENHTFLNEIQFYKTKHGTPVENNTPDSIPPGFKWKNIPPFSVITGVNGVGKTHLLKAIYDEVTGLPAQPDPCQPFTGKRMKIFGHHSMHLLKDTQLCQCISFIPDNRQPTTHSVIKSTKKDKSNPISELIPRRQGRPSKEPHPDDIAVMHILLNCLNSKYVNGTPIETKRNWEALPQSNQQYAVNMWKIFIWESVDHDTLTKVYKSYKKMVDTEIVKQAGGEFGKTHSGSEIVEKAEMLVGTPPWEKIMTRFKEKCTVQKKGDKKLSLNDPIEEIKPTRLGRRSKKTHPDDIALMLDLLRILNSKYVKRTPTEIERDWEELSQFEKRRAVNLWEMRNRWLSADHDTLTKICENYKTFVDTKIAELARDEVAKTQLGSKITADAKKLAGTPPWTRINKLFRKLKLVYRARPVQSSNNFEIQFNKVDAKGNTPRKKGNTPRKLDELSSGENAIVSWVTRTYDNSIKKNCKLLFLDEPDVHLHPLFTDIFIKDIILDRLIKELGIQVILTTHDPATVTYAPPECVFLLKKINQKLQIRHTDQRVAVSTLSGGRLLTVQGSAVVRHVLVENEKNDAAFYGEIWKTLLKTKLVKPSPPLLFRSFSTGCSGVMKTLELFTEDTKEERNLFNNPDSLKALPKFIFGLIDKDNESKISGKRQKLYESNVLRQLDRYIIENYLCEPLYYTLLALKDNNLARAIIKDVWSLNDDIPLKDVPSVIINNLKKGLKKAATDKKPFQCQGDQFESQSQETLNTKDTIDQSFGPDSLQTFADVFFKKATQAFYKEKGTLNKRKPKALTVFQQALDQCVVIETKGEYQQHGEGMEIQGNEDVVTTYQNKTLQYVIDVAGDKIRVELTYPSFFCDVRGHDLQWILNKLFGLEICNKTLCNAVFDVNEGAFKDMVMVSTDLIDILGHFQKDF